MTNRRQFLSSLGAALIGAPLADEAQAASLPEAPVTPVSPPLSHAPGKDNWTRLDDGNVGASLFGPQFTHPCLWGRTGDVWAAWNNPTTGSRFGTFMFRRKTNKWEKVTFTDDIQHNISNRENYGSCYDPDGDRIWISNGAPASMWNADCYFDPNTNTYTNFGDFTGTDNHTPKNRQLLSGVTPLKYFRGSLYSIMTPSQRTRLIRNDLPYGKATVDISGAQTVSWKQPYVFNVGEYRGGMSSASGLIWIIGDNNELYIRDLSLADFVLIPTFGTKPPHSCNFEMHERLNLIVAWCGQDIYAGGQSGPIVRSTYYLDLNTLTWRQGPSLASGDFVPGPSSPPQSCLMYDYRNDCMILWAYDGSICQVWRLDIKSSTL